MHTCYDYYIRNVLYYNYFKCCFKNFQLKNILTIKFLIFNYLTIEYNKYIEYLFPLLFSFSFLFLIVEHIAELTGPVVPSARWNSVTESLASIMIRVGIVSQTDYRIRQSTQHGHAINSDIDAKRIELSSARTCLVRIK